MQRQVADGIAVPLVCADKDTVNGGPAMQRQQCFRLRSRAVHEPARVCNGVWSTLLAAALRCFTNITGFCFANMKVGPVRAARSKRNRNACHENSTVLACSARRVVRWRLIGHRDAVIGLRPLDIQMLALSQPTTCLAVLLVQHSAKRSTG